MRDQGTDRTRPVDVYVKIPWRLRFGDLQIRAGGDSSDFYFFGGRSQRASSFSALVRHLAHAEHNYDLVAELTGGASGSGGVKPPAPALRSSRVDMKTVSHQDRVVRGRDLIRIVVR